MTLLMTLLLIIGSIALVSGFYIMLMLFDKKTKWVYLGSALLALGFICFVLCGYMGGQIDALEGTLMIEKRYIIKADSTIVDSTYVLIKNNSN